jgi:hypothetical protein
MHMHDEEGKQRILMHSPTADSWIRIGEPNDPPSPYSVVQGDDVTNHVDSYGTWVQHPTTIITTVTDADNGSQVTYRLRKNFFVAFINSKYYAIEKADETTITYPPSPASQQYTIDGGTWTLATSPAPTINDGQIKELSFNNTTGLTSVDKSFAVAHIGAEYKVIDLSKKDVLTGAPPAVDSEQTIKSNKYKVKVDATTNDEEIKEWTFGRDDKTVTLDIMGGPTDGRPTGLRLRSRKNIWLESQERYGDYSIGGPAERDEVPAGLQYLWDKFFDPAQSKDDGYAPFEPTGMAAYDYQEAIAAVDPTVNLTSIQELARTGRLKLGRGDVFITQEGNVYDFGGYWVYNLGNGYVENQMTQDAELNTKQELQWPDANVSEVGASAGSWAIAGAATAGGFTAVAGIILTVVGAIALASIGAPAGAIAVIVLIALATTAVAAIAMAVIGGLLGAAVGALLGLTGEFFTFQDNIGDVIAGPGSGDIKTWAKNVELHTDTTWVTKSTGDAYNFSNGKAINIDIGDSEDHVKGNKYEFKYGGRREYHGYNKKGMLTSWNKSGGGHKQEAKWDGINGQILTYSYSHRGHFSFSVSVPAIPKLSIDFAFSSLNFSGDVSAGMKMTASFAAAMSFAFNISVGLAAKIDIKRGGEWNYNEVTKEMEWKSFGLAAQKAAAIKAKIAKMDIEQFTTKIDVKKIKLEKGELFIDKKKLKVDSDGLLIQGTG